MWPNEFSLAAGTSSHQAKDPMLLNSFSESLSPLHSYPAESPWIPSLHFNCHIAAGRHCLCNVLAKLSGQLIREIITRCGSVAGRSERKILLFSEFCLLFRDSLGPRVFNLSVDVRRTIAEVYWIEGEGFHVLPRGISLRADFSFSGIRRSAGIY